jgi:tRNA modification GTPase
MFYYHLDDPIIACATSQSETTAVAIIRLSGFKDSKFIQKIFPGKKCKPRYAHYSILRDGKTDLDDVLYLFFPAPNSFTGENVLEIHCHGNTVNVSRIIDFFTLKHGFRMAGQGEFSYRAFKNKKLSLSQVEGLGLFLNATSPFALDQGLKLLHGDLHSAFQKLQKSFLNLKSHIDMSIDFAEDIGEEELRKLIKSSFLELKNQVKNFYQKSQNANDEWLNPKVVLVGPTNAGKSSLFNLLLQDERAIVSSTRGTTRDFISESLKIEGHTFKLIDTAGIRETSEEIERLGIERSKKLHEESFFKILVVNPNDSIDENFFIDKNFDLVVFTHSDQKKFSENREIVQRKLGAIDSLDCYTGPIGPDGKSGPIGPIKGKVLSKFLLALPDDGHVMARHRQIFSDLFILTGNLEKFIQVEGDLAVLSSELSIFSLKIEELIGNIDASQVLDNIFGNFCIGK